MRRFAKYRERYKTAVDRCAQLEDEVDKLSKELSIERESKILSSQYMDSINRSLDKLAKTTTTTTATETTTAISDTSTSPRSPAAAVSGAGTTSLNALESTTSVDSLKMGGGSGDGAGSSALLRTALEMQSKELAESRLRLEDALARLRVAEERQRGSDERSAHLAKELSAASEQAKRMQREAHMCRDEAEKRMSALEQRFLATQRECAALADMNARIETELAIRDTTLKHVSDLFFISTKKKKSNIYRLIFGTTT